MGQPIFLYGSECLAITNTDGRKTDAVDKWCLHMLPAIKWHQHVRNDEVRRTTEQLYLSTVVYSRRLSSFVHIARIPDEANANRIFTASRQDDWRRPQGRPHVPWFKTCSKAGNQRTSP